MRLLMISSTRISQGIMLKSVNKFLTTNVFVKVSGLNPITLGEHREKLFHFLIHFLNITYQNQE